MPAGELGTVVPMKKRGPNMSTHLRRSPYGRSLLSVFAIAIIAFITLGDGGGTIAQVLSPGVSIPEGLQLHVVLYYPFVPGDDTGTILDYSGNRYHGVLHGAKRDKNARAERGISLDGEDDHVSIPGIHLESFTFAALVKASAPSDSAPAGINPLNNRCLFCLEGDKGYFSLQGDSEGSLRFAGAVHGRTAEVRQSEWRFQTDSWTPIAVSYDGLSVTVYEKGEVTQTGFLPGDDVAGTVYLGGTGRAGESCWRGGLDEVILFDKALRTEEIGILHAAMRSPAKEQVFVSPYFAKTSAPAKPAPAESPGPATGAGKGLMAHYSFDSISGSEVLDTSGRNKHATSRGPTYEQNGRRGGALYFDGEDDFLSVDNVHFDEFTFSAFVKTLTPPSKRNTNNRRLFLLHDGPRYYTLQGNSGGSISFEGTGRQEVSEYGWQFQPHTWTHVAVTYSRPTVRLYKDGKLTEGRQIDADEVTGTLFIGGTNQHYGRFWHGMIDEVILFDRALSEAEIESLHGSTGHLEPQAVSRGLVGGKPEDAASRRPFPFGPAQYPERDLRVQVEVHLTDGSHLIGEPKSESVALQHALGELDVPITDISTITRTEDRQGWSVELQDGDRLTGNLNLPQMEMTTLLGKVVIPIRHIEKISVSHTMTVRRRDVP